jgi:hypothetical protein
MPSWIALMAKCAIIGGCAVVDFAASLPTGTTLLVVKTCVAVLQAVLTDPAPIDAHVKEPVPAEPTVSTSGPTLSTSHAEPTGSCEPQPEGFDDVVLDVVSGIAGAIAYDALKKISAWIRRAWSSRVKPVWNVRRDPTSERWSPITTRGASYAYFM